MSTMTLIVSLSFLWLCCCIVVGEYLWNDVCTQEEVLDLPFCDTTLDVKRRVDDLLSRIPPLKQIQMMVNDASGYEPLYIPPYQWWNEGLHGVYQQQCFGDNSEASACPTSFPCPSALATSFNDTLFYLVASAIGREGRAISNIQNHNSNFGIGGGLTFWTPVVNMQRDPRWGRNLEAPGEDPFLTSRFAVQYVKGLQQIGFESAQPQQGKPMQVAACCKHFVANSLEMWQNVSRHDFDAHLSEQDLHEYYFPPFIACIQQADVAGIMCSYNAVNGVPSCINQSLLKDLLRHEWKFRGYITSDCGALDDVHTFHHYSNNPLQTALLALNATTNLNCGRLYTDILPLALEQGWVSAKNISDRLRVLLTVQMKLGLYDQPKNESLYAQLGIDDIDSPDHQTLALEAAQQSIVLLQNKQLNNDTDQSKRARVLPLPTKQRIAVIGPHTNATTALLGSYRGWRCPSGIDDDCILTPLAAIAQRNEDGTTESALGCHVDGPFHNISQAQQVASGADAIVLVLGLDSTQESEGLDRDHTMLPGHQRELMESILSLNNPRTVLVLINGGAVSLGSQRERIPAIIQAGYGGQAASEALADVLFGKYNPSGRLAATVYPPSFVTQMKMTDMAMLVKNHHVLLIIISIWGALIE